VLGQNIVADLSLDVPNEVAGHRHAHTGLACELRVLGLRQFAVPEGSVEIAHGEVALCNREVDVRHPYVSPFYFVQSNHIVIDGGL